MNLAIFASGNGSNAENIIRYFRNHRECGIDVALVICNRPEARVLERASALSVPTRTILARDFRDKDTVLAVLEEFHIDAIVLAGFLLMVPDFILERYPERILNIHPSLLPKYGGKGMYGHHVHEAVIAAGEKETGITIHLVTDKCDEGASLFQARINIAADDTPQTIETKIHQLEQHHFPRVIAETFGREG